MRQLYLTTFFSFFVLLAWGQNSKKIDELKNRIQDEEKELIKIDLLVELVGFEDDDYDIKNDIDNVNELIKLSEKNNIPKGLISGYKALSTALVFDDFEKSIDFILKAKKISESIDDYQHQLECIIQAGYIYADWHKYDNALSILNEGIEIIKNNSTIEGKCKLYVCFGYVYSYTENDELLLDNYKKALNCSDGLVCNDCFVEMRSYEGLCWSLIDRKQYEKAEEYAKLALLISERINSDFYKSTFNRILGRIYSDINELDLAAIHFKIALKNYKKGKYKIMVFDQLNYLSFLYSKKKEYYASLKYADSAIIVAKETNVQSAINSAMMSKAEALINLNDISKGESLLKEVSKDTVNKENWQSYHKENLLYLKILSFKKRNNFKEALAFTNRLHNYKDSLNKVRFNNTILNSESKLETEFKEKENLQLKAEKAEQAELIALESKRKWQMAGGLAMAFVGFGVFGFYYRRNKKQKEAIENLQRELHHRVKNNLSIIDTFIDVVKDEFNDDAINNKLSELQNRIDSINEVHKQLYASANVTDLNLKKYIDTLANNVQQSFPNNNISIEQHIDNSIKISPEKSFPLGLIINEFITNSYKYAFNDANGKIEMTLKEIDGVINVSLSDNGKGLPKDFNPETSPSFGLRIIKLLSQQLKGTYHLESKNGVHLNMQFPK
ncbi:histidine kinase dimerization/phosphoacceptor domain -containing protein [Xanthomarina sp. F2636L]|uniref:tetratricopeptide repeat-containing sensor histidine kinase n=1 Tax=Xanthomarina sp. F2636L TaxID=2996018 RepID=UPI00225E3FF6|nr:histidine kinase dimerization/phosphoacceptor domain -containing protein [Xanthomarina sp. F2636L]MCX7551236.1 hypothetical protein [Xanthomarina sp. F2636L]